MTLNNILSKVIKITCVLKVISAFKHINTAEEIIIYTHRVYSLLLSLKRTNYNILKPLIHGQINLIKFIESNKFVNVYSKI